MVAGAAAASRAPADAVTPTSASRRVKVFPMGAVIADGPIRCCGKTRLSGPSLVASYRQILRDKAGAVSHKAVSEELGIYQGRSASRRTCRIDWIGVPSAARDVTVSSQRWGKRAKGVLGSPRKAASPSNVWRLSKSEAITERCFFLSIPRRKLKP